MINKILKEFDEEFECVYYGKDFNGTPNYPPEAFKQDVKDFLFSSLTKVLKEVKKEILKKYKKVPLRIDIEGDAIEATNAIRNQGYNLALSDIQQIISKLKQ